MASYTRLGSYLLASELAADPCGRIHRALTLTGSAFERHHLVRTFSEELLDAGLGSRLGEAQRVASLLAGARGFGANYHIETGRSAHVAWDYVPGRSLAQVLKKTREEQIPLGVDHALSVLQGMAQSLLHLHGKGIQHGCLSPHSVWVSFEGATQILDAPFAGVLQGVLPKARTLEAALAPYRPAYAASPLQRDLFALGAILFEMLTLERIPAGADIPSLLAQSALKAAQEEGPIPAEIQALLSRLLLAGQSFPDAASFNGELERVLYDGDYSPTTFNMAFFMHTLFREENEQDAQAMKADQGADFTPFLPTDAGSRTMLEAAGPNFKKYAIIGGGALAVILGGMLYFIYSNKQEKDALQAQLASLQQEKATNEGKLVDLAKQEEAQKALQGELAKKASEAKTAEERAKAKKDLEESKRKTEELMKQREEALRRNQEIASKAQSIAQASQSRQDAPRPAAPAPQPAPAPQTQAPQALPAFTRVPNPPQQQAAAPQSSGDQTEVPPTITRKVVPAPPRMVNRNFLPPNLRDSDIRVSLKVFVDAQGHPLKVIITKGVEGPFGFNDSAQNAALASSYSPATRGGRPTTGWVNLDYNFGRVR